MPENCCAVVTTSTTTTTPPTTTAAEAECDLPAWLDKSFLKGAIEEHLRQTVHIRTFRIEPATAKGENYASAMYRVNATYTTAAAATDKDAPTTTLRCIVKIPYDSGFGRDLLDSMTVYDKELIMYETVLPALRRALDEHGIADELVARTIHVSWPRRALVFEDLAEQGFRMPASTAGLDMEHAVRALHKLAVFHAGCAYLRERDATVFERHFRHGMLNRNDTAFDTFYLTLLDALAALIATWPEHAVYAGKLAALRPHLLERGRRAFDAKPGHFHTLIHGDIWVNNTMFTYGQSSAAAAAGTAPRPSVPERTMLVDFQFCCWASPTIDLHYFFNTSLREDLRPACQDELLQAYHAVLVGTLRRLGFGGRVPTLRELHVEFMQNSFYAFISACLVQPIMLNEQTTDADIGALHGDDARALRFKRTIFTNAKVQSNVRKLLPFFDRRGLFDVDDQ